MVEELADYFFKKLKLKGAETIDEEALRYHLAQLELLEDDEQQARQMIAAFSPSGTLTRDQLRDIFAQCKINFKSFL